MRIKVLSSAVADLHAGRLFYEEQAEGVGAYFFDSLFSDIDSLALYAGIHPNSCPSHHENTSRPFHSLPRKAAPRGPVGVCSDPEKDRSRRSF